MAGINNIWICNDIATSTKSKIMNVVLVFLVSECGIESWSITKAERKSIDSFEMVCWRCILRISSCVITRHISVLVE